MIHMDSPHGFLGYDGGYIMIYHSIFDGDFPFSASIFGVTPIYGNLSCIYNGNPIDPRWKKRTMVLENLPT